MFLQGLLYISIPSGWAMMFNDTDRENVKNAVRDASAICLGNEMHTSFEIMVVDPEVSGADIITEDDLRDALKDLKFEKGSIPIETTYWGELQDPYGSVLLFYSDQNKRLIREFTEGEPNPW